MQVYGVKILNLALDMVSLISARCPGGNGDSSVQENNQALEDRERKLKICIKFYIYEETQNL